MRATLLFISLLFGLSAAAVELVMRANNKASYNTNKTEATSGQSVQGMIIDIGPDGKKWGTGVKQPDYIIIKMPGVDYSNVVKYLTPEIDAKGETVRYRQWKYAVTNLAISGRRLFTNDSITIKATGGNLTWDIFKTNLWDLKNGTTETATLP